MKNAATVKRQNAMRACRKYLEASRFAEAQEYASTRGFTVAEARLHSFDQGRSLPYPPGETAPPLPTVAVTVPLAGPTEDDFENGWPKKCTATIWNMCRNPRLVLIQLPDGRQAAMWRDRRRNWRIGSPVKVELESATADPLYVQVFDMA